MQEGCPMCFTRVACALVHLSSIYRVSALLTADNSANALLSSHVCVCSTLISNFNAAMVSLVVNIAVVLRWVSCLADACLPDRLGKPVCVCKFSWQATLWCHQQSLLLGNAPKWGPLWCIPSQIINCALKQCVHYVSKGQVMSK